jgi:hypothetical protein
MHLTNRPDDCFLLSAQEGLEAYSMGCVLHREQFFMSARVRFTTALVHLQAVLAQQQQATPATAATTAAAAAAANGTSCSTNCCMREHCTSTAGICSHNGSSSHSSNTSNTCCTNTSSSGSSTMSSSSSSTTSQLTSLSELIVACHLNIAAGALLQQRDCPLAVLHCTQVTFTVNCFLPVVTKLYLHVRCLQAQRTV